MPSLVSIARLSAAVHCSAILPAISSPHGTMLGMPHLGAAQPAT
jgi:hypothetical protein